MSGPTSPGSTAGPPPEKNRMLVLCFDGTANEYNGENTNVVKFFAMLRKDCDDEQLCYYQTGVGTYDPPGMMSSVGMWFGNIVDEAIAWYLDDHVMDGYKFLMNNYRNGDKISIFGFSRGAYTARALAGFLTKVGLLPRGNDEQVTFAYKMYTRTDKEGLSLAAGFKETFCRSVGIEFLGVWDTVASTGVIMSRNLPFTTNNSFIKIFRHALSLDEHRAKFVPTFWQLSKPQHVSPIVAAQNRIRDMNVQLSGATTSNADAQHGNNPKVQQVSENQKLSSTKEPKKNKTWFRFKKTDDSGASVRESLDPQESNLDTTDVKEVWFSGCHSDVGGGAVDNSVVNNLADIPLRWMVREVVVSQCGIQFDAAMMETLNVHVNLPAPEFFRPTSVTSEPAPHPSDKDAASDKIDSTMPLHDELRIKPIWWILELVPLPFSWQDATGVWHSKWRLHLGKGRYVNHTGPLLFHETVRERMSDASLKYIPTAIYEKGKESYVW